MPTPTDPAKRAYLFSDDMKFLQKSIVLHPDGTRFLTIKRSPADASRPGKWDLPGGNVQFGELHEQSLRREIEEETGLDIRNMRPIQVWTHHDTQNNIYHLFIGYVCQAADDMVRLSEEHTEYRWVDLDAFESLESADYLIELARTYNAQQRSQ